MKARAILVLTCGLVLAGGIVQGQKTKSHAMVTPGEIQWKAGPSTLPAGAQMVVLAGDPAEPGFHLVRYKFPAGYRIPPHFHPIDENIIVVSGVYQMGMGDNFDIGAMTSLPAGSFATMPAGTHHYAMTTVGATVDRPASGIYGITYVNPKDDPRNAARQR